jgi:hypothetical protein
VTFFDAYSSTCLNPGFLLSRFLNGFTAYPGLVVGGLVRIRVFARPYQAAGRTGAHLSGQRGGSDRVLCVHDSPLLLAGKRIRPGRIREHGAPDDAVKTLPRKT